MSRLDPRLYLVLDPAACRGRDPVEVALAAVRGGVTIVQYRDKAAGDDAFAATARRLVEALEGSGVPLIVNDRVRIAPTVGAAGVHVGQTDRPAEEARALLGAAGVVGLSTHTPAEAAAAPVGTVDYVGAGPVFGTRSKADHERPVGLGGLAAIAAATALPAVAIGGLGPAHAAEAIRAGAAGVAVLSAICSADDPEGAARALRRAIDEVLG